MKHLKRAGLIVAGMALIVMASQTQANPAFEGEHLIRMKAAQQADAIDSHRAQLLSAGISSADIDRMYRLTAMKGGIL